MWRMRQNSILFTISLPNSDNFIRSMSLSNSVAIMLSKSANSIFSITDTSSSSWLGKCFKHSIFTVSLFKISLDVAINSKAAANSCLVSWSWMVGWVLWRVSMVLRTLSKDSRFAALTASWGTLIAARTPSYQHNWKRINQIRCAKPKLNEGKMFLNSKSKCLFLINPK